MCFILRCRLCALFYFVDCVFMHRSMSQMNMPGSTHPPCIIPQSFQRTAILRYTSPPSLDVKIGGSCFMNGNTRPPFLRVEVLYDSCKINKKRGGKITVGTPITLQRFAVTTRGPSTVVSPHFCRFRHMQRVFNKRRVFLKKEIHLNGHNSSRLVILLFPLFRRGDFSFLCQSLALSLAEKIAACS